MSKLAAVKKPGPGKHPDFSGVPGELMAHSGEGLVFAAKKGRVSPYDALLEQLAAAGPGKVLRFGDLKARASVTVRARKKGLRVSFAEQGQVLYVRFDGSAAEDTKATRRTNILKLLKQGPRKVMAITVALRDQYADNVADVNLVQTIVLQMERAGELIHQEGDLWAVNPRHKG